MTTELAIFRCLENRFLAVPAIIIFRQRLDLDETRWFQSLQNFEICLKNKLQLIENAQK